MRERPDSRPRPRRRRTGVLLRGRGHDVWRVLANVGLALIFLVMSVLGWMTVADVMDPNAGM
jgi:hypothetical protein